MSKDRCTRAWQAEALHDGRLSKQDAGSFERHAATCSVCAHELEALAQLKATAQQLPVLTSTELEHHRLRQELLRRAHAASTQAPRTLRPAWFAAGALALAVASAAAVVRLERAPSPPPAVYVPSPPSYEAQASPDAVWHAEQRGPALRIALERGQLELSVTTLQRDQRFIVQLPDGELEVKGTRFVVHADAERTTAVRVIEGRVALRLNGRAEAMLGAGDAFEAPSVATEPIAPAQPAKANTEIKTKTPSRPVADTEPHTEIAEESEPAPATESTFARAMTAFEAGDFGRADALFEQFEREHPRDSRVEDALFLRALARARRGEAAGARTLALDYLARFPSGLRRADAERLTR